MAQAKSGVMLANAHFPNLHIRSSVIGILILEDGEKNVNADARNEKEVNVSRPLKKFQFRVQNIDDSVAPSEVSAAAASLRGCGVQSVRSRELSRRW